MSTWFDCPYLGAAVEVIDGREAHIRRRHPALAGDMHALLADVLVDPDVVGRRSFRPQEMGFIRIDDRAGLPGLVVVVVLQDAEAIGGMRYWVVTAYPTDRTTAWRAEWEKT